MIKQNLTIEQIRERINQRSIKKLAARAGVHYNTLLLIARGGGNPTLETLRKIEAALYESV